MKNNIFKIAIIAYAILISVWLVSWLTFGDANWWLVLLNRFAPFLFIAIPIFLIWGFRLRQYRQLWLLLIPYLIFTWLYHPYLFPQVPQISSGQTQFSVMTYNVLFSNHDYDAVAKAVLTYEPDLVALQEVQPEMMDELEERLGRMYPYSMLGTENNYGTTAIFSKTPLTESHVLDLQADRPAVVVKTSIGEQEVTFVAVHLLAYNLRWTKLKDIPEVVMQRTADQNRQAAILLNELNDEKGIIIVGCDCNSYETASSYRVLAQSLNNAAREVGWLLKAAPAGLRQDLSLQHIDYVWFRGPIEPAHMYKVRDDGGSDHKPVLALFNFR